MAWRSSTRSAWRRFFLSPARRSFVRASALVIGEHEGGAVKSSSISAVSAAAAALGSDPIALLLAGSPAAESDLQSAARHATRCHPAISSVLVARAQELANPLAEPWAELVLRAQKQGGYSHIFAASSSFGKDVIPRAAALFNVSPLTDVTQVVDQHTFIRPIYAGNALSTVRYKGSGPCIVTIRPTSFPAPSLEALDSSPDSIPIKEFEASSLTSEAIGRSQWMNLSAQKSERPDLGAARIVISGGRGLKSAENFKLLEQLADKLGAAVGASRAAVDAGFVPKDMQIGQTGKIVAPDLYIAVGISGAIQHLAGIKDSKVIVAINKDKDAPIFQDFFFFSLLFLIRDFSQVADYGLAIDLFEALPELLAKVSLSKK